jgi:hypothetical protein
VNKRLVRKLFPIPKISRILQELEEFSFATALDLNIDWIQMHPKFAPSSFFGENIPTRTRDYHRWALQVL